MKFMRKNINDKIRIIYYIPQLTIGGGERHLYDLITLLDKKLFQTVVFCPGPWGTVGDELISRGIEVLRFSSSRLLFYLAGKGFDIFHSFGYGPHYKDAIIAKMAGIPIYISSRRNMRHWEDGGRLHFGERIRNYLSDIVVANAEAVKKKAVEIERINPERIRVIYCGVNFAHIPSFFKNDELKKELGILGNDIVMGNLANLKPIKGQRRLIEAFAEVLKKFANIKLVIAGEGPEEKRLLELADKLNIRNNVIFVKQRWNRFELLDIFDIFVLSSYSEGFPHAVIEAMAMGKPVVCSFVGGIPEAVIDGQTGFLFQTEPQLAEKILLLIEKKALRDKMGAMGKQRVKDKFDMREKVKEYEGLYEDLLRSK